MTEHFQQISPITVREVAQQQPTKGDFRQTFSQRQEAMAALLTDLFDDDEDGGLEFGERMAAALWTIYERAAKQELPPVPAELLERFLPPARELVRGFAESHGDDGFDPELLATLPRGNQPHVMGFLVGALRAARLRLSPAVIMELTIVLIAMAGALETIAGRLQIGNQDE